MKLNLYFLLMMVTLPLSGCFSYPVSSGQNSKADDPYFVTTTPLTVKKVLVPKGTKLTYALNPEIRRDKKHGPQTQLLSENLLTEIRLPLGQTMMWGSVPIVSIERFFNSEMRGYSVIPEMKQLPEIGRSKFAQLWRNCDKYIDTARHAELGISVKDISDWSFNQENIADVESCTGAYQRYFKDDAKQQKVLDDLITELRKLVVN